MLAIVDRRVENLPNSEFALPALY